MPLPWPYCQSTLFVAFVVYDTRRQEAGRLDCCCCLKTKDMDKRPSAVAAAAVDPSAEWVSMSECAVVRGALLFLHRAVHTHAGFSVYVSRQCIQSLGTAASTNCMLVAMHVSRVTCFLCFFQLLLLSPFLFQTQSETSESGINYLSCGMKVFRFRNALRCLRVELSKLQIRPAISAPC